MEERGGGADGSCEKPSGLPLPGHHSQHHRHSQHHIAATIFKPINLSGASEAASNATIAE